MENYLELLTFPPTASTEEIPQDSISKEECQLIEVKKLCIENKMIDLQLSLSRQFEMCIDLEEYVKLCKTYEPKMDHCTKHLCYCILLQNAQVVDCPVQSGDSPN